MLHKVLLQVSLSRASPDSPAPVQEVYAKTRLIGEEHLAPVIQSPPSVLRCELQACLHVFSGERYSNRRSSSPEIHFMESPSHCLSANSHPCSILQVVSQADCRQEPVSLGLHGKKSVLCRCCCPLSSTTMTSTDTARPPVSPPSPGNDALSCSNCSCNFPLCHASLQHPNGPIQVGIIQSSSWHCVFAFSLSKTP